MASAGGDRRPLRTARAALRSHGSPRRRIIYWGGTVHRFLNVSGGSASCAVLLLFALACTPSSESSPDPSRCLAIAVQYQSAMAAAVQCDPAGPGECSTGRPVVVSVQNPDGSSTVEGLCMPPCYAAVNPSRTGSVDAALAAFYSAGCTLGPCWCPPPGSLPPMCLASGVCSGLVPPP